MADKLMYIPNDDTPSVDYNSQLKRLDTQLNEQSSLDTQLNEQSNQIVIKVPMLLSQQIRKRYNKTLGTTVINSQMSPPSLLIMTNLDLVMEHLRFLTSSVVEKSLQEPRRNDRVDLTTGFIQLGFHIILITRA